MIKRTLVVIAVIVAVVFVPYLIKCQQVTTFKDPLAKEKYKTADSVWFDKDSVLNFRYNDSLKVYYYMWSYQDSHSNAWGENSIACAKKPSEMKIKLLVWNTLLKPNNKDKRFYHKQFKNLEIITIVEEWESEIEPLSPIDKAKIRYPTNFIFPSK